MKSLFVMFFALAVFTSLAARAEVINAKTINTETINKEKVVAHSHEFSLTVGQIETFLSSQYRMPVHLTAVAKRPFVGAFSEVISFGTMGAYFRAIEFEAIAADGRHLHASCDLDVGFPTRSDLSVDECLSNDGAFKNSAAPLSDFATRNQEL